MVDVTVSPIFNINHYLKARQKTDGKPRQKAAKKPVTALTLRRTELFLTVNRVLYMPFLTLLSTTAKRGSEILVLNKPLAYHDLLNNQIYVVPAGFETNLASIPPCLRSFIDNDDPHVKDAAVIHDWLYTTGQLTRAQADAVLFRACRNLGAGYIKAYTVYLGVRIGGAAHYQDKKRPVESTGDIKLIEETT